jgi:hypothetical protein
MRAVALTSSHPRESFPHADLVVDSLTGLTPKLVRELTRS